MVYSLSAAYWVKTNTQIIPYGIIIVFNIQTRNMHAHFCLAPVRRLCMRASYVGAGEVRVARATFAVGEASCLVFVVSKPRWPRCAVVPDFHLHHPRSIWVECIWMCQTCNTYSNHCHYKTAGSQLKVRTSKPILTDGKGVVSLNLAFKVPI